ADGGDRGGAGGGGRRRAARGARRRHLGGHPGRGGGGRLRARARVRGTRDRAESARGPAGAELPHRGAWGAAAGGARARHRADGERGPPGGVRQGRWVDGGDARWTSLGAFRALRCGDGARTLYLEFTLKGRPYISDAIAVSGIVALSWP